MSGTPAGPDPGPSPALAALREIDRADAREELQGGRSRALRTILVTGTLLLVGTAFLLPLPLAAGILAVEIVMIVGGMLGVRGTYRRRLEELGRLEELEREDGSAEREGPGDPGEAAAPEGR